MKRSNFALTIIALIFLSSCGSQSKNDYGNQMNYDDQNYNQQVRDDNNGPNGQNMNYQDNNGQSNQDNYKGGKMKPIGVTERNSGIQMWSVNLPSSWDFTYTLDYSANKDFPGTDWQAKNTKAGVTASNARSKSYVYSTNQNMLNYFQQAGSNVAQPQPAGAIQQSVVASKMQQKGYQKTNESRAQAHEQRVHRSAGEYGISGLQITVISADWSASDGRKAQTLLYHIARPEQTETTWWYESVVIEGKGKSFDRAAKEFDNALVQVRENPKWVQYTKQVIANQNAIAQQNFNANQQRINNNQRNFEAQQRAIVGANDAVNQSIMDNWKTQNQASDYSQQQFTDYIRDEQNVYDPNSGNTYKVESGYNQYYVNDNGEYIGTNDYNYNPNQDQDINNQNWSGTEPYY